MTSVISVLDASTITDISDAVIDETGRPRVLPASFYENTTPEERGLVCHRHGLYCLPTVELADFVRETIGGRTAIEIGAGNGALAEKIGIHATDKIGRAHV